MRKCVAIIFYAPILSQKNNNKSAEKFITANYLKRAHTSKCVAESSFHSRCDADMGLLVNNFPDCVTQTKAAALRSSACEKLGKVMKSNL